MKLLYLALSTALTGVVLAGCSDSGGNAPAASATAATETTTVAQAPVTPAQAPTPEAAPAAPDPATETTTGDAAAGDSTSEADSVAEEPAETREQVVDITRHSPPPTPASVTDLGTATDEELRREAEMLRPRVDELRDQYKVFVEPLREIRDELQRAIDAGDAAETARLRAEHQALADQYLPAITEFRNVRDRVEAIDAHLEARGAAPRMDDASN